MFRSHPVGVPFERDLTETVGRPLRYAWVDDGRCGGDLAIQTELTEEPTGYRVEEKTDEPFPGRVWLLAKADGSGEVYQVECGRGDGPIRCSCSGYKSADRAAAAMARRVGRGSPRAACKHTICFASLLGLGLLDARPTAAEAADAELWAAIDQMALGLTAVA